MKRQRTGIPGSLVCIPLPRQPFELDGFLSRGPRQNGRVLIVVHGLGGNFYHSSFKRELMRRGPEHGFDVLSFNNRGSGEHVATERFSNCVGDIDAAIAECRRMGYGRCALLGHSTGCQKITHYQALTRDKRVKALVLAAPADDSAIARRDLGNRYRYWMAKARQIVADGDGNRKLPQLLDMSARRFLSLADTRRTEARLFDYGGPMTAFRRLACPVFAFFGSAEEYACKPVAEMGAILAAKTGSSAFEYATFRGADHGFHGHERKVAGKVFAWLSENA